MILGAFIAALPSAATAQDELDGAADSIADQKVHVAFREVDQSDLMGGVSFVDMENLFEKRYSTYSLTDMMSVTTSDLWDMGGGITLVDGVERPANDITPSEISQVTYLKGAQAVVLYGGRAATTKPAPTTVLRPPSPKNRSTTLRPVQTPTVTPASTSSPTTTSRSTTSATRERLSSTAAENSPNSMPT